MCNKLQKNANTTNSTLPQSRVLPNILSFTPKYFKPIPLPSKNHLNIIIFTLRSKKSSLNLLRSNKRVSMSLRSLSLLRKSSRKQNLKDCKWLKRNIRSPKLNKLSKKYNKTKNNQSHKPKTPENPNPKRNKPNHKTLQSFKSTLHKPQKRRSLTLLRNKGKKNKRKKNN